VDREELAQALADTASLLYEVWRCNDDDERAALGTRVGAAVDAYAKHPSHPLAED
jgi:hypothetical protein